MDFHQKPMWFKLQIEVAIILYKYMVGSKYENNEMALEVMDEVIRDAPRSVELELSRQKKAFYISGLKNAAKIAFHKRIKNKYKKLRKLEISSHDEFVTNYKQNNDHSDSQSGTNYFTASKDLTPYEHFASTVHGFGSNPETALALINNLKAYNKIIEEVTQAIDKLNQISNHGQKYAQIATCYLLKPLAKIIEIWGDFKKEHEISYLCLLLGHKLEKESDRKWISSLRCRTKKYWKERVGSDQAQQYIDDLFNIKPVKLKVPTVGKKLLALWNKDAWKENQEKSGKSIINEISNAEKAKYLIANRTHLARVRRSGYLGCYSPSSCPKSQDDCPCLKIKHTLRDHGLHNVPKAKLVGIPTVSGKRGPNRHVLSAVKNRPKKKG